MRTLSPILLAVLLLASPARGQERNQLTLDASAFRGTAGYARALSPTAHAGAEAGWGSPRTDLTLTPSEARPFGEEPSFDEYVHLAVFLRHRLSDRFSYDVGVRTSAVDLWDGSDHPTTTFVGGYVQPMLGGRRWSVGPRIVAGWTIDSDDGDDPTFTLSVAPVNVRLTLDW